MSVRHLCELLGVNRSSLYLEPAKPSASDLLLMEKLDRWHLDDPDLGSRKLATLVSLLGEAASRVRRLMRVLGRAGRFPRPKCAVTSRCHKKDSSLLKGVGIETSEGLCPRRCATVRELDAGPTADFDFDNRVRPHQSLGYRTPAEVHEAG